MRSAKQRSRERARERRRLAAASPEPPAARSSGLEAGAGGEQAEGRPPEAQDLRLGRGRAQGWSAGRGRAKGKGKSKGKYKGKNKGCKSSDKGSAWRMAARVEQVRPCVQQLQARRRELLDERWAWVFDLAIKAVRLLEDRDLSPSVVQRYIDFAMPLLDRDVTPSYEIARIRVTCLVDMHSDSMD